jgi:hypothetical protein
VLAFSQTPPVAKEIIFIKVPTGFEKEHAKENKYFLKIHRNMYGQKNAGQVWNEYLVDKLINKLDFKQSKIDECVFYRVIKMYALYTDDLLLAGPSPQKEISQIVTNVKKAKLDRTDEDNIEDFLGINIDIRKDGTVHLTQLHLIDQILKTLRMDGVNVNQRTFPLYHLKYSQETLMALILMEASITNL